jgi:DNA modification methylase
MIKPVYEKEGVTLYHASCEDILLQLIQDGIRVDAVVTDPPYNVGFKYTGAIRDDRKDDYREWCRQWFTQLKKVCSGPIAFTPGIVNLPLWYSIESPWWVACWWKPACMGNGKVGPNNWEPVLLYGKKIIHNASSDVIRAPISTNEHKYSKGHPCPKPIKWATGLLKMLVPARSIVLDPFAGSGTTAIACLERGLKCICIESDSSYVDSIISRLDDYHGAGFVTEVKRQKYKAFKKSKKV